jgi:hypothetical protein
LPHHLAFVIYAASCGVFVLGGLQAVFETSLHRFVADLVDGESLRREGGARQSACAAATLNAADMPPHGRLASA